ncbi:MAG: 30S ribosomal protein S12 methylthiotransferase RimO [Candidatus Omnitrophica bacterium]|nr:30S ribosomal protein S12 methylthiotransferase RimO [Candidatus Omnitrophota bacterium]
MSLLIQNARLNKVSEKCRRRVSVGMLSLGCPKTLVDSELILGMLDQNRYEVAEHVTDCDIALLNTCAFINEAKEESLDHILNLAELKREGRIKALVVLGCLVQRYPKELEKELREVDAFMGTGDYRELNHVLDQVVDEKRISYVGHAPGFLYTAQIGRLPLTPLHTRYIKISEGCDHICSFCTIPSFRGRHRSRGLDDVVSEARHLVKEGARELVLTGQDTTYFGRDTEKKFLLGALLQELNKIEKLRWIRILYAYPSCVDEALIETIGSLQKVCHYLDMPLQHVSDSILRSMRRGMTKKSTYALIGKLRRKIPNLALRTTFIVGYPGEREGEFRELLGFMEFARFDRLGLFTYSQEDESDAALLDHQVPERIKEKRFREGMQLQQRISKENNERLVGRTLSILIEGADEKHPHLYFGRSYMDAPEVDGLVYVRAPKEVRLNQGDFVRAKVIGAKEYDLSAAYLELET